MSTHESKHTPGPWAAYPPESGDSTDFPREHWEINDCYGTTATVYGDDEEAAANARLIAAAPELLAFVELVMRLSAEMPLEAGGVWDLQQMAAKAIAKAEGKS